jgi:hypothetical protein
VVEFTDGPLEGHESRALMIEFLSLQREKYLSSPCEDTRRRNISKT